MSRRFRQHEEVTITLNAVVSRRHRLVHEDQQLVRIEAYNGSWEVPIEAVGLLTEPEPDTTVIDRNGDRWRRSTTHPDGRHWRCLTPAEDGSEYTPMTWRAVTDHFGPVQRATTRKPAEEQP